jgi:hypothetical protein
MTKKERQKILHSLEEQVKTINPLAFFHSLVMGGKIRYILFTPRVSENGDILEGYIQHSGYYTLEEMRAYLDGLFNSPFILKKLKG